MAFKVIGNVVSSGDYFRPMLKKFPVVSTAMRMGAVVTKALNSTSLSLATASTATSIWGVTNHSVASSATGEALIELTPSGTIFEVDVKEIAEATALTATGGGATTFVDSSIVTPDDVFIGAVIQAVSCAATPTANGTNLTLTDNTGSSGTLTFATGTLTFATSDTAKFISISNTYAAGWGGPRQDATYADRIVLDQTASADSLFKVIGTNSDGTKLWVVLINGIDSPKAVDAV